MKVLLISFLFASGLILLVGAGCASSQSPDDQNPTVGHDIVINPQNPPVDYRIPLSSVELSAGATTSPMTAGELSIRQAMNTDQGERAQQMIDHGIYLGDTIDVLTLSDGASATFTADRSVGDASRQVVLFRMAESGSLRAQIDGEPPEVGRRMPSMIRIELAVSEEATGCTIFLGDANQDDPSLLSTTSLPPLDSEYGHRLEMEYAPGSLIIRLDGQKVLEEIVRIGGADANIRLANIGSEDIEVFNWTFQNH